MCYRSTLLSVLVGLAVLLVACAPAAQPSPTAAPSKAASEKPAPAAPRKPAAERPTATSAPTKPAAEKAPAKPTAKPSSQGGFDAKAVADFYTGKTIRIVVGFAAGGGFDAYSRLIARYLGNYVPGKPNVIVENKPGAASMVAANDVYNAAEKDGTVIANFNENLVLLQATGKAGVEYDARKFQWLASVAGSPVACAVRKDSGVKTIQDVMGTGKQVIIGTDAPGANTHDVPAALKEALDANLKLVPGYAGTAKIRLAVENKEVDGGCWTWNTMATSAPHWFDGPDALANPIVVMGSKTPDHPWLKGVPAANNLAKSTEAKQLLTALSAPSEMSKPYAVAPEVAKERVAALRAAFSQVLADKAFLEEAKKAELEVEPSTGEQVEATVKEILDTPPQVLAKLKALQQ